MYQRITAPLFYSVNFLQSIFLLLSLSTYIIPQVASNVKGLLFFSFGNSGRESNPPFQPTTRLSPKIVSGDQPSTVSVIKPYTLSLFILRKVNSISESLARNSTGCSGKPRIIRILSHSLPILYQIWQQMSRVYSSLFKINSHPPFVLELRPYGSP